MLTDRNYEFIAKIKENGSITKAAEDLYVSQPALSQFLSRLETELGFIIFNRNSRPMTLTKSGEIYWNYLEEYISLKKQMINDVKHSLCPQQKITIGLPFNLQPILAEKLILNLTERFPNISLDFSQESSLILEDYVYQGLVDLAIINCYKKRYPELYYIFLQEDYLLLVGEKKLAQGRTNTIENPLYYNLNMFEDKTFILADENFLIRKITDEIFKNASFTPSRVLYNSNISTMISLASKGEALAFIPAILVKHMQRSLELSFFKSNEYPTMMPLVLVSKSINTLNSSVNSCISLIKELLISKHRY